MQKRGFESRYPHNRKVLLHNDCKAFLFYAVHTLVPVLVKKLIFRQLPANKKPPLSGRLDYSLPERIFPHVIASSILSRSAAVVTVIADRAAST